MLNELDFAIVSIKKCAFYAQKQNANFEILNIIEPQYVLDHPEIKIDVVSAHLLKVQAIFRNFQSNIWIDQSDVKNGEKYLLNENDIGTVVFIDSKKHVLFNLSQLKGFKFSNGVKDIESNVYNIFHASLKNIIDCSHDQLLDREHMFMLLQDLALAFSLEHVKTNAFDDTQNILMKRNLVTYALLMLSLEDKQIPVKFLQLLQTQLKDFYLDLKKDINKPKDYSLHTLLSKLVETVCDTCFEPLMVS